MLNPELQHSLSHEDVSKDSATKYITSALPTAAQPFAQVWVELIQAEMKIECHLQLPPDKDCMVSCPGGHHLDISELIQKMHLGLRVLGVGAVQANQKRHADLRY